MAPRSFLLSKGKDHLSFTIRKKDRGKIGGIEKKSSF